MGEHFNDGMMHLSSLRTGANFEVLKTSERNNPDFHSGLFHSSYIDIGRNCLTVFAFPNLHFEL